MGEIKIKKITYLDTFPVRSAVLRQGKPIETCFFLGDDANDTTHFGLFDENNLIGVASVFKVKNENFDEKNQFQLRGMAVLNEYQGLGYGNLILDEVCKFVDAQKAEVLWFNARENAVKFYQNFGFSVLGNSFEIPEIGTHFAMFKYFVV
ncbi:GNAT family N-acetyltransferase [Flavobacterium terrigena]|uniref:Acetyltransferase (GNAT) domain-containing protein n=1 Tax=Flavobacterium terrigena TaxID=402734 RepID=A0A1H6WUY5_9FLAO|nr:GNAT family N-acetyltransferase [Flavobacterium terrigena]SEJ20689.1 Acetyltransferase (GNAT) domain-containing protein [Flavobacterium terrigena]